MVIVNQIKKRRIAWTLIGVFGMNLFSPIVSYALTSGPTQPELQAFQPAGTTDMVDIFSGDFSYNIPLFELPGPNGGYPFNLSYQSCITMDQEASWVGLGWSLNPGAINRQVVVIILIMPWLIILSRSELYSSIRISGALFAGIAAIGWIDERVTGESNQITKGIEILVQYAPWVIGLLVIAALFYIIQARTKVTTQD